MNVIRHTLAIAILAVVVCPGTVQGGAIEDLAEKDQLFGDWAGIRPYLEERGLLVELVYTAEWFGNTRGGLNTSNADDYRGDVSLTLELDTETAGWWEGGMFFAHLQEQHGYGITDDHVGDFQVLSNIDADDYKQVSEFWYRHSFLDDALWVKLGKMEANEDFVGVDHGGEFINSSFGFIPTVPLTTYPDQDWGVVLGIQPVDWFSMNVGVYQGDANGGRSIGNSLDRLDGPLAMIEPAVHYSIGDKPGSFRIGAWYHGSAFDELDKGDLALKVYDDSSGYYITVDQCLYRENPDDEEDEQGLGMFLQYGWAQEDRMEAHQYVGAGLLYTGLFPMRDDDITGLAIGHVELSDELVPAADGVGGDETVVELFYKVQAAGWLSIKPDVQFISNPGGFGDDAVAIGVRTEIVF